MANYLMNAAVLAAMSDSKNLLATLPTTTQGSNDNNAFPAADLFFQIIAEECIINLSADIREASDAPNQSKTSINMNDRLTDLVNIGQSHIGERVNGNDLSPKEVDLMQFVESISKPKVSKTTRTTTTTSSSLNASPLITSNLPVSTDEARSADDGMEEHEHPRSQVDEVDIETFNSGEETIEIKRDSNNNNKRKSDVQYIDYPSSEEDDEELDEIPESDEDGEYVERSSRRRRGESKNMIETRRTRRESKNDD